MSAKPKPKLDVDRSLERLDRLGLAYAAEALPEALSQSVKRSVVPQAFLDGLLDVELAAREERRVKTALRLSNLPTGQTLADFDFALQPAVERSRIETLATGAWIRSAESLLIQGPPGVGRTHLAVGLGVKASSRAPRRSSTASTSCSTRSRPMPTWRRPDSGARST